MSLLPSNTRDRRMMIVLIAALAVAVGYRFGLSRVVTGYSAMREEVVSKRKLLSHELGLLEHVDAFPAIYARADSILREAEVRLFAEQDALMATEALYQYVREVARRSSVLLTDARNDPATTAPNGLKTLQLYFKVESDFQGITKWLDLLESGPKVIKVTELTVKPATSSSESSNVKEVLSVTGFVHGFGVDTAIVRGLVAPPAPAARTRAASRGAQ
jgi:hypothetical protein